MDKKNNQIKGIKALLLKHSKQLGLDLLKSNLKK